ncbi:peptidoglycan-associated lipoprotein Pal [Taklimakanibacter albus]|uniref:Peptidoglycan-associated lipoprotein Pal n=1 Tax=Taklimakanibacter albus TaxID=2800327 RepID=A0ACC5R566_9HYPH|nr:peptidoglycan-associated lipoprotein Pal [Aestuariivirga sp. YIM B02566]MBK1867765.1 peptidoglycan-associated lipoprotein Pal [Aestuariivirga sp. YIM B02566]
MLRMSAGFKAVALCFCFLALAACSKKNTANLEDENGLGRAAMAGSEQQFKTEVGDTVFYLVDQSTLTPEGQETLRRQAAWLKQYSDVAIQVEGHADERGTREYNIALSARRATTTRQFLISQGIEASRISSIAYGKERPAALCDAEQCYSQNRRTVTVITSGAKTS